MNRAGGDPAQDLLGFRDDLGAVGTPQRGAIARSAPSAEQAECARPFLRSVAESDRGHFGSVDAKLGVDAETAPPASRACGVGGVFVLRQEVGVLDLEHFVVLCQNAAGAVDEADVVVAVGAAGRARPAFQREKQDVGVGPVHAGVAARDGKAEKAVPARGYPVRNRFGESFHDRVGCRPRNRVAESRRRRERRVEERSLGVDDPDPPQQARIMRNAGIYQHQEGQDRRRSGGCGGRVDEAGSRRRRTGEVEGRPPSIDRDCKPNAHFRIVRHAIVENGAFAAVDAVGDGLDLPRDHRFGAVEQMVFVSGKGLEAVSPDEIQQPAFAYPGSADLRLYVFFDDGVADVREHHPPDVPAQFAAFVDLERRNAERFLPDFSRVGVVAARLRASDIGLMPLAGRPADERSVVKDRPEHGDVVVLVAPAEHVVVQNHVARMDFVSEERNDLLADRFQGEREHRDVFGLLQHVAVRVVQPRHEVASLVQDRRPRGAQERQPHLFGDRFEAARNHGCENRIDQGPALRDSSVSTAVPKRSTNSAKSSGTRMVVAAVSTTAGPVRRLP